MGRYLTLLLLVLQIATAQTIRKNSTEPLLAKSKTLVTLMAQDQFDSATVNFDATMKQALPASKLKEVWRSLQLQGGTFRKILGTRTEAKGVYQIVYVVCQFEKMKLDAKVVFNEKGQIAGLFFLPSKGLTGWKAPDYVHEEAFTEVDTLKLPNAWHLPATLSLPINGGPFPAVVLVHGSGPNDRDESIGPNKPFKDLAWGLASRGIAVLRYEKRTRMYAHQMDSLKNKMTVNEETIEDALSAVSLLRKTPEINPDQVVVLGHSLGGYLIPRIAPLYPRIAGFIIMAGPTRPLTELILDQLQYIYNLDGKMTAQEQEQLSVMQTKVKRAEDAQLSLNTADSLLPFGVPATYWLDLQRYDPLKAVVRIRKPLLILQGGRDYQVTMKDYKGWKQALKNRSNATFALFPSLNHLFISGKGKSIPGEYENPGHVSVKVIHKISNWIHEKIK